MFTLRELRAVQFYEELLVEPIHLVIEGPRTLVSSEFERQTNQPAVEN
jgi:hypothetical protein